MCSTVANLPWLPPISAPNRRHTLAHQLGPAASPAVQNVAAHVYRFLHRAFQHWPVGQSAEQLDAVVDLWLAVAFPWTGVDRAKCVLLLQDSVMFTAPACAAEHHPLCKRCSFKTALMSGLASSEKSKWAIVHTQQCQHAFVIVRSHEVWPLGCPAVLCSVADVAQLCRYTAVWRSHVLAHLPFYFCLLPMYLDLVTHTASVAAQQAAKHLRRVGRVRL